MQLAQWNPFREMDDLVTRMRSSFVRSAGSGETGALADWAPSVDISETGKEYVVKGELPGVKKDDVKVTVQNGVLTLSGERRFEKEEKDEKHHRVERAYGSFTRSFVVPDDVVGEKVAAEFKDGILTIRMPKAEIGKTKASEIRIQ